MPLPATTSCSNRENHLKIFLFNSSFCLTMRLIIPKDIYKILMAAKLSNNTPLPLLSWHKTQYFLKDPPIFNMLLNSLLNGLRLDCQMCCSQLIPPLAYPWWLNCLTARNAPTHPPILTQTWAWTFLAAEA